MKTSIKVLMLAGALCCMFLPADAQENKEFWGKSEAYLNNQAFRMFELADQALTENPPVEGAPMVRKLALYNLDAMLHETKYDNSEPFNNFIKSRIGKVIADLENPAGEGMRIYKIYNDGFVARTGTVTVAFDLVRGACNGKHLISDEDIAGIVRHCDVLFLSHNHGDHVDPAVVDMFLKEGKQVIATSNILPDLEGIQHEREEKVIKRKIKLQNGAKLKVTILPGHQSDLLNNMYVVTTEEGLTVAQIGDQYNRQDIEWIMEIHKEIARPDALIVNCWTHRMNDLVNGFNPKLVMTGHENEMGHTIDHREAFWLTFRKMEEISKPYVVMGWGEWYNIQK